MASKAFLLSLTVGLLGFGSIETSLACQYCRMAATDPEAARMAAQIHSGGFPLDAALNQFQGIAPAAVLTAPPAPDSVAPSAADLPPVAARLHSVPVVASVVLKTAKAPVPMTTAPVLPAPVRWSDAGLVGLCAAGGLFYWRTRRPASSAF